MGDGVSLCNVDRYKYIQTPNYAPRCGSILRVVPVPFCLTRGGFNGLGGSSRVACCLIDGSHSNAINNFVGCSFFMMREVFAVVWFPSSGDGGSI